MDQVAVGTGMRTQAEPKGQPGQERLQLSLSKDGGGGSTGELNGACNLTGLKRTAVLGMGEDNSKQSTRRLRER